MVTLSSGKVYVGNYVEAPTPGEGKEWIRLEPLLSGFRSDRHRFEPTTSYFWIHAERQKPVEDQTQSFSIEDYDILVPIDGIQSVHAFDMEVYESKFKDGKNGEEEPVLDLAPSGAEADHAARIRPKRRKEITVAEWVYFAYVTLIFVIPVVFFFGAPLAAGACLGVTIGIARLFIGAEAVKQKAESTA
jgi:hypothetical protein